MKNIITLFTFIVLISTNALSKTHPYTDNDGFTHEIEEEKYNASYSIGKTGYNNEIPAFKDIKGHEKLEPRDAYKTKKVNGNIEIIGATISIPKDKGFSYEPILGSVEEGSVVKDIKFLKEDSSYSTNSSRATFNFSQIKNQDNKNVSINVRAKDVVFARLYWASGITVSGSSDWGWNIDSSISDNARLRNKFFEKIKGFNKIRFGTPDGHYHNLTALESHTKWYGSFTKVGMQFMYHTSVDVTEIIQNMGDKILNNAVFSAGNIKSSDGKPGNIIMYRDKGWSGNGIDTNDRLGRSGSRSFGGHYGGWSLVIVYDLKDGEKAKAKNVTVFDGLHILAPIKIPDGDTERIDKSNITFDGFYTPTNGNINSSLTVLSFGAKKEVGSEDIKIKKGSDYKSVTSENNEKGKQFNSTITKFGKYVDSNKIYNNQMDLDTYDISDHITNKQTKAEVELQAKVVRQGYTRIGERANISFVAFSTDVYVPGVCYNEELLVAPKDGGNFKQVSKKGAAQITKAKKGDILRSQVTIVNPSNETAEQISITTDINDDTGKYLPDSTYLKPYASGAFSVGTADKRADDSSLQKLVGKNLQFFIGQGASSGNGGNLKKDDKAFIQYDITLDKEFKPTGYKTKFSNASLNIKDYEGVIKRCVDDEYALLIEKDVNLDEFKVVNEKFSKDNDSENLYTQLANRSFNLKIVHKDKDTKKITNLEEDVELNLKIVDSCESDTSLIAGNEPVRKIKLKGGTSIADIKDITIQNPHTSLYAKLIYTDVSTGTVETSCKNTDPFAVRPKEFKIYDTDKKTQTVPASLTGGKGYKNIGLIAIDAKDNAAKGYTNLLKTDGNDTVSFTPVLPTTCNIDDSLRNELTSSLLQATFSNASTAIGTLTRIINGASLLSDTSFSYPDVGEVTLSVVDGSYTAVDKATEDCIIGSDTTTKDANGKIGCNISLKATTFKFLPKDIYVDNLKISDFQNNMTYLSNSPQMSAAINFDLTARLDDDKTARLYSSGCYSKDNNFTISIDRIINEYTDNDAKALSNNQDGIDKLNTEISFFADSGSNITKLTGAAINNGSYNVPKIKFNNGVANNKILFNFSRLTNLAKNPFSASSEIFTFSNVSDADGINGAAYTKPAAANITSAKFYYGRVYAPYYEGPKSGFDANIYYGVYCNNCNQTYVNTSGNTWAKLPSTVSWQLNPNHAINEGYVSNYQATVKSKITRIPPNTPTPTIPTITNGTEAVNLQNNRAVTDLIKMNAPQWLIYNTFDTNAATSDFNVKFIDRGNWAGKALKSDGKKDDVGEIIGGSELETLNNKTNRRIEW
ncbi:MAG: hypothetical protein LUC34_07020 [Campylobacter sp.]|nr:hypothetical protein [Campylobacter sp.]